MVRYDTFICYRGSIDNGIGKTLGAQIYEQIGKNHPVFGETFFAPEGHNYDFMREGQAIISKVKYFIVVLSSNFFSDFEKNGRIDAESVTYQEMLTAFRNPNCRFLPVFAYGFSWKQPGASWLRTIQRLFPDGDTGRLTHQAGVRIEGNVFTKEDLVKLIPGSAVGKAAVDGESLCEDLRRCGYTIANNRIILKRDDIQTDFYEYQDTPTKYLMPDSFLTEFAKVSEQCALPQEEFCYWPVDLSKPVDLADHPEISICAICFGIIILHNWVNKDAAVCVSDTRRLDKNLRALRKIVDGATNLLIALRSPRHGSWPSFWDFENRGIEGTINQTTLSVSTLLTCGFLSPQNEAVTPEVFKNRYAFIRKSIGWIIKAKNTEADFYGDELTGWGHMAHSKELMVMPTAFALDTLFKFECILRQWLPTFETADPAFFRELRDMLKQLQAIRLSAVSYFDDCCNPSDGSFRQQESDEAPSVTHTAKVQKTLQSIIADGPAAEDDDACLDTARQVVRRTTEYLTGLTADRVMHLQEHEIFELFAYRECKPGEKSRDLGYSDNQGEKFEHCGELIYIDAMVKVAQQLLATDRPLAEAMFGKAVEVFGKFRDAYVRKGTARHSIMVLGKRAEVLKAPIYSLYYYRMVLDDISRYLRTEGE